MSEKKRCAMVGVGHRMGSWITPVQELYGDRVSIVGLCDAMIARCHDAIDYWELTEATAYDDYDRMLAESKPDLVVVCTPEHVHAEHIVKALDAGCEVATEKPLCTTGEDARAILEAERRSGRKLFMGFNYRHIPLCLKVKELLVNDVIGTPVSVDLQWYLDYKGHGGSYFRRWHSIMAKSGGLLVTKATHHFDMVNWWVGDVPATLYAQCSRNFFGTQPGRQQAERCSTCPHPVKCDFYRKIDSKKRSEELGYKVREVRDYEGDLCVFRDEIDIYDTHAVMVRYRNGCVLNYTLNASVPFEGWNVAINGTKGRIETGIHDAKPMAGWQKDLVVLEKSDHIKLVDKKSVYVARWPANYAIHVLPHDKVAYQLEVPNVAEGHGGGDQRIMAGFYAGEVPEKDPLGAFADAFDGAISMAIGAGANLSAERGTPVEVKELLGDWLETAGR